MSEVVICCSLLFITSYVSCGKYIYKFFLVDTGRLNEPISDPYYTASKHKIYYSVFFSIHVLQTHAELSRFGH